MKYTHEYRGLSTPEIKNIFNNYKQELANFTIEQ